jgi:arginase
MKQITIVGAASGLAAQNPGCGDGPAIIAKSAYWERLYQLGLQPDWQMIRPAEYRPHDNTKEEIVAKWGQAIAHYVQDIVQRREAFFTIGGDHACAIGTWYGVAQALHAQGARLGLIWVDAHLDSHTHATTLSGNIHGMPVAALLGYGHPLLTKSADGQPALTRDNLCFVGVRSYESGELAFINALGVKVYYMPEIKARGVAAVLEEAVAQLRQRVDYYGISVDLDAFDPTDAPGVGTPEPDGMVAQDFCQAVKGLHNDKQLIGFEIAEFNPHLDKAQRTEKLIFKLISALALGETLA